MSDPVAAERRAVWWARASMAVSLLLVVLVAWVPVRAALVPVVLAGVAAGWLVRTARLRRRLMTVISSDAVPVPVDLECEQPGGQP